MPIIIPVNRAERELIKGGAIFLGRFGYGVPFKYADASILNDVSGPSEYREEYQQLLKQEFELRGFSDVAVVRPTRPSGKRIPACYDVYGKF